MDISSDLADLSIEFKIKRELC